MHKIRNVVIALGLLSCSAAAPADVSIGIGLPNVSIGINVPTYPELHVVPGYPVYYAPNLQENFFFYDGMYWVYRNDNWYASSWYNGPWAYVQPRFVPVYILRVPVRYYRHPPAYFHGWQPDSPPQWSKHWGHDWEKQRRGWDKWDHRNVPQPAPPPRYQREYSGDHYPRQIAQQYELRERNYRYEPHEPVVQKYYQQERNDQGRNQGKGNDQDKRQGKDKGRGQEND